ncbi:hypothetical protein LIER_13252 [Lithospermum erythrorhizon]|uniref:Uncharacterized protein n=1 Tax=Lithospermum erythrorhizon TaxID=34254 RepID=A0AAV3PUY4_LITER
MEKENLLQNGSIMDVESPTITISTVDGKPMDFVGPPTTMVDEQPMANPDITKEKKRTKFGLLKIAVRMFQPAPKTVKKQAKEIIKEQPQEAMQPAQWEKIVGSMRPLHLQENLQSPTPSVSTASPDASPRNKDGILSEESFISSPATSLSSKRSDIGTMSQYNSAVNLQDLDNPKSRYNSAVNLQDLDTSTPKSRYCSMNNLQDLLKGDEDEDEDEEEEAEKDPDEVFESITGDDMIDSKADEFIAKFYQGMSLERSTRNPSGVRWRL